MTEVVETPRSEPRSHGYPTCASHPTEHVVAGAKLDTLYGVDVSDIDPETSIALTRAILAREPVESAQRIVIIWSKPNPGGFLDSLRTSIEDADTGEAIVDVTALSVVTAYASGGAAVTVDLTRLLHEDGEPLGRRSPTLTGDEIPTGVFRHIVAEMRIAE